MLLLLLFLIIFLLPLLLLLLPWLLLLLLLLLLFLMVVLYVRRTRRARSKHPEATLDSATSFYMLHNRFHNASAVPPTPALIFRRSSPSHTLLPHPQSQFEGRDRRRPRPFSSTTATASLLLDPDRESLARLHAGRHHDGDRPVGGLNRLRRKHTCSGSDHTSHAKVSVRLQLLPLLR